jgi:dynein heavy chain
MKKPPAGVKLTMEACCIILQVPPARIPNPNGKGKINDYWFVAQKELLGDPRFLSRLLEFDKENMPEDLIEHVKVYTDAPDFTPEVVKRASVAAAGICKWVHAMVVYDQVAKVVRPKREALKLANGKLEVAQEMLAEKQAQLNEVESNLARLQQDLLRTTSQKEELERQKEECIVKLDRAERLLHGLGGEKVSGMSLFIVSIIVNNDF